MGSSTLGSLPRKGSRGNGTARDGSAGTCAARGAGRGNLVPDARASSATAEAGPFAAVSWRGLASAFGILLIAWLAAAPQASADRYQFAKDLGAPGAGDGQLDQPKDVAVDE